MRVIVLFLALASFGCAATRSGGGDGGALIKRVLGPQSGQMGQSDSRPAATNNGCRRAAEREERYCEIAAKRLAQEVMNL